VIRSGVRPLILAVILALAAAPPPAAGQYWPGEAAVGQFYAIQPPQPGERSFNAVQIERVAPHSLAFPPPITPLRLPATLRALTGQVIELLDRQRLYFTGVDVAGALRLFEIDLLAREIREIAPRPGTGVPYAAQLLASPDASKIYVQWFSSGTPPGTDIYDGASLYWLGQTSAFRPDERAAGFEHQPPFMWTLDLANRPVLIDTQRDRIVRVFDYQRIFGPTYGAVSDGWRDLLLVRLEVGHDRYRVVDTVSGELGPPLDLEGYRQAQPRLALAGRLLVLIDMERRPLSRAQSWRETAIATGGGVIYDLRTGERRRDFNLIVPPEFPVSAVGTTPDPGLPGRLWLHVPGDDERLDFSFASCDRKVAGDEAQAGIESGWQSDEPLRYPYRVRVNAASDQAVAALAIQTGREIASSTAPDGWGIDRLEDGRWVRWMNGLGPASEDVAAGSSKGGFEITAQSGARPGIGEYRIQAAIGLPRGCESDDRFLDNALQGYTVVPERVQATSPADLARRLQRLTEKSCDIGWIRAAGCEDLRGLAGETVAAAEDRAPAVETFLAALGAGSSTRVEGYLVLSDAASAILASLERVP
jgi:hypothetical protein